MGSNFIEPSEKSINDIKLLVEQFGRNENQYKNSDVFDEENCKVNFINPFFEALGWDLTNKKGLAPQYKEVVFEENVKVGSKSKAPDYSFRIGGQKVFFVEAKKPSVKIESDKNPAFQIRRYGWSAKLNLCILTDFEDLAVYETNTRPDKNQSAGIGRIKLYHYTDYVKKWKEIYNIFSKEAVLKGEFDKFINNHSKLVKKGTNPFDKDFLDEINNWRLILARNIALRNKELSITSLNFAVQLIMDRIIFLRMAEDRGIEKYETLYNLLDKDDVYEEFCKIFKKADLKYDSGLFHFNEVQDNAEFVDNVTLHLKIDNGVFKQIFKNLYYPNSPYEFSVISPEILGNIYEQFLGSVITLTPSHQARVEQKPEVKKAGGVYYTPTYVVKYIVENTVGELINGKEPDEISEFNILDPACGSGSFLLGAYQKLLDYHLQYYLNMEEPPKDVYYIGKDKQARLTIREKKRILINNIYGVDIDVNAVEVTKLSLLLKVLEDENKDVLEQQQKLYQEKVLPNLSNNIKCGNSLVGTDILEGTDFKMEDVYKINPFDWENEFPVILSNGGFDLTIGNPPYGAKIPKNQRDYLNKKYGKGGSETAISFVKLAYDYLLKDDGRLGYIIPKAFTFSSNYKSIREYVLNNLEKVVDCGKVWKKVKLEQCIIILNKALANDFYQINVRDNNTINPLGDIPKSSYDIFKLILNNITLMDLKLAKKIKKSEVFLNDVSHNSRGGMFQKKISKNGDRFVLGGANIQREGIVSTKGKIDFKIVKEDIKSTIKDNSILVQRLVSHINKPIDHIKITACIPSNVESYVIVDTINQITFNKEFNIYFFWALLNSKLINWYVYRFIYGKAIRTMQFDNPVTKRVPLPKINFKENIQTIINEAKTLNNYYHDLNEINTPNEKRLINNQIINTEKKINDLIYGLYDLTSDEIKIIEDSF